MRMGTLPRCRILTAGASHRSAALQWPPCLMSEKTIFPMHLRKRWHEELRKTDRS